MGCLRPRTWLVAVAFLAGACGDDLRAPCADCAAADAGRDESDAGPVPAVCDDGNACTTDTVADGACRFDPVADGTPCDDGDLCTLGDGCQTGACSAGDRASGELAVLGRVDNLSGRRLALGQGRFVVVTVEDLFRGRVQVVRRTANGLDTLSTWQGELTFVILGDDDILAHAFDDTGLVAVSATSEHTLRLFTAGDEEVVPRGTLELTGQVTSMSGRGDRLWLCTGNFITGYQVTLVDVADPDAPVEVGGMSLGGTACGSTAVSQDGKRVYVNTAGGVRFVDASPLDSGGDPILSDVFAPTAGVSVSGDRLLLMEPTAVRILSEPALDELVSVPVARPRAAALFGDRLLVEGHRAVGGDSEVFVAWYDASGVLLDQAVLATFIGAPVASTFRSASDGDTLLTGTHAFDLTGDRLDPLRLPALLPLRTLARSAGGLRTYHASGAAALDVADATAPAYAAGGAFADPRPILTVALDSSIPAAAFAGGLGQGFEDATRVTLDPSNPYFADPLPIDRWTLDDAADLVGEDRVTLAHQGSSQLFTAGDVLYRYQHTAPAAFQGTWLPGLASGATAVPFFDLEISASTTTRRGLDVDPRARIAVLSTETAPDQAALLFYDLSSAPPALVGQIETDELHPQLRVSGRRVAAIGSQSVVFFDIDEGEVSRLELPEAFEIQLLAFDGTVAYLTQLHIEPGNVFYQLVAATFGAAGPPAVVEVNATARSLVPIDTGLAIGFDTQMVIVHPQCP